MPIDRARFSLALEQLKPDDWAHFERLASAFLVDDYKQLRVMAASSGDGGRDAALFSTQEEEAMVFQFSVAGDWKEKVRLTVERLSISFPTVKTLVYMTSQVIGAKADALIRKYRQNDYLVDICDKSWFLDRANTSRTRESAAETLAIQHVNPLISSTRIDDELVAYPNSADAKTALVFIEMQIQDSSRSYGLTKASFDALTLAALRETETSNRMSRADLCRKVQAFLPSHPDHLIKVRVDAALLRLKNVVRHRRDKDEFHLTEDERKRVSASMASLSVLKSNFEVDLEEALDEIKDVVVSSKQEFLRHARLVMETYFFRKGEDFAQAASTDDHQFDSVTLKQIVFLQTSAFGLIVRNPNIIMLRVLESVLTAPRPGTSAYILMLLQSYTLFAFLAATPDVQRLSTSMFAGGVIWVDTSALLPLLAEVISPEYERPFGDMFSQADASGIKLCVSTGVLEEVERHINRCKTFTRLATWTGFVPFLFSTYVRYGGKRETFASWAERFLGENDPIQDLADYFRRNHRIYVESAAAHPFVPESTAAAVRDRWQEIHVGRRPEHQGEALRLAAHDTEVFLHVLSSRLEQRGRATLGYSHWWLTLDRHASQIIGSLEKAARPNVTTGPVISIDFLIRYLAFGPNRAKVDLTGASLASVYTDILIGDIPPELLSAVEAVRADSQTLPEAIVQRRIRDKLNSERSRLGSIASAGLEGVGDVIRGTY